MLYDLKRCMECVRLSKKESIIATAVRLLDGDCNNKCKVYRNNEMGMLIVKTLRQNRVPIINERMH